MSRDKYLIRTSAGLLHKSSCRFFVSQEFGRDLQSDRCSPKEELPRVFSDPVRFRHQLVSFETILNGKGVSGSISEENGTIASGFGVRRSPPG